MIDGLTSVSLSYSFTTKLAGSAFGFDYVLANRPYVPPPPPPPSGIPLPNSLMLLLTAMALMLGGVRLKRGLNGGVKFA